MSQSHAFVADAMKLTARRNMNWYQRNLLNTLHSAKDKQARDIDDAIGLAHQLIEKLNEKVSKPVEVPVREEVERSQDDSLMKPIEPELLDIIYKGTEKGDADRYLRERYKKLPEDRFYFRIVSSWDYGWQQKQSRVPPRSVNRGRQAILRDTFYRRNNLGPDPPHYNQPSGGEVSICSEYSCSAN